jgi:hypothetical protein
MLKNCGKQQAFYVFHPGPAFLPKTSTWMCPTMIIIIQTVE